MTIQDEISKLERQLADLKAQQARCAHEWGDAKYNPYTGKQERILHGQYETHGIHMYPRTTFDDVEKPRWTRVCKKCGLTQHTEKQSDIPQPKQKAPDFEA